MIVLLHLSTLHFLIMSWKAFGSLNDSSQLQFIINSVFAAANILVAGFIPIWIFIIQNKRGLAYEVNDEIVHITNPTSPAIQGCRVILRLWNVGGQAIIPEENYGPIEFVFGGGADIREAKISRKYPATLGVVDPAIEDGGTKIVLAKPSTPINKTYWVEFELLMMKFQGDIQVNSNLSAYEIKDIPQKLMQSRKVYFYSTYIVFFLFFLITLLFSVITHSVLNQFVDLMIVGGIWLWWLARKFDFSPRKFRQILRASPLVLALLISYMAMHFATIYVLMPNVIKIWG